MQFNLQTHKYINVNSYNILFKLVPLILCCFLPGCAEQKQTQQVLSSERLVQISENAVNINTASAAELEKLPHVGAQTAKSIIDFREKFGRFRKPEHLMLVRRISDSQFREMRTLVKVE